MLSQLPSIDRTEQGENWVYIYIYIWDLSRIRKRNNLADPKIIPGTKLFIRNQQKQVSRFLKVGNFEGLLSSQREEEKEGKKERDGCRGRGRGVAYTEANL